VKIKKEELQMATVLNSNTFDEEVLKSDIPVMVDFYADWCGPCKMLAPVVEELSSEMAGKAKVFKLNTDESPDIAMRYRVMSIPALIFFKNGEVHSQIVGAYPKAVIQDKFNEYLK